MRVGWVDKGEGGRRKLNIWVGKGDRTFLKECHPKVGLPKLYYIFWTSRDLMKRQVWGRTPR